MSAPLPADRLIIQALKNGIAVLVADAALFNHLLRGYTADEKARERARFLARTPTVMGAFARTGDKFPLWAVVLGDEQAEDEFVGQFTEIDTGIGTNGSSQLGNSETQSIAIWIHCEHPDETRSHHTLAKAIIRSSVLWMIGQGALSVSYGGAHDVTPEENYLPENIFTRMQTWNVLQLAVAYEQLPAAHDVVYVHRSPLVVDGHTGGVVPVGQ